MSSSNNLKQIMFGDAQLPCRHNRYPSGDMTDAGKPLLSWRVANSCRSIEETRTLSKFHLANLGQRATTYRFVERTPGRPTPRPVSRWKPGLTINASRRRDDHRDATGQENRPFVISLDGLSKHNLDFSEVQNPERRRPCGPNAEEH